ADGEAEVIDGQRVIRARFVAGERREQIADLRVVLRMRLEQRQGQTITRGGRILVAAELPEKLAEACRREGIVLLAIGLAGALQEHVGLLLRRELGGAGGHGRKRQRQREHANDQTAAGEGDHPRNPPGGVSKGGRRGAFLQARPNQARSGQLRVLTRAVLLPAAGSRRAAPAKKRGVGCRTATQHAILSARARCVNKSVSTFWGDPAKDNPNIEIRKKTNPNSEVPC